jgi:hypothetical protein
MKRRDFDFLQRLLSVACTALARWQQFDVEWVFK